MTERGKAVYSMVMLVVRLDLTGTGFLVSKGSLRRVSVVSDFTTDVAGRYLRGSIGLGGSALKPPLTRIPGSRSPFGDFSDMSDEKLLGNADDVIERLLSQKLEAESARIYILWYYGKTVSAHDVADALGLGYHCLRKKFKHETGQSIGHFLIETKIEAAKELFLKTNLSVKEVSFEVGFRDPSHFSKIFKKYTGASPLEFKASRSTSKDEGLN